MKKIVFAFLLILICASLLLSCNNADSDNIPDTDTISHSGYEAGFTMLRYNWSGYGIGQKEISACDLSDAIIDCLSNLQETGSVTPKISNDTVNEFTGELPIERGTVWIECEALGLFRLNPEMTEICKVKTHLGKGKVLQITDTLKELLRQAWYYHPYDYWSGAYENGTVSLQQEYKSDSVVEWVEIESIHIENEHHSENNKISLHIRANESKAVKVCLKSYQSDDNLGSIETKEIELINGDVTTVDFTFNGFYNDPYWVSITIDNTKINLEIDPKSTK